MARKTVTQADIVAARRVRAAMHLAGLEVGDLCAALQMTPAGVRGLLSDERRRSPITIGQFCAIADVLGSRGVRLDFLVTGRGSVVTAA